MPYFQAAQRSPATFQAHQLLNGRDRQVTEPFKYYLGQLVQKREVEVKFGPHRTFGSNDHDGNGDQGYPDPRDFIVFLFQGPVQQAGETSNGFNSAAALGCHGGHASSVVVHNLAMA